MKRWQVVLCVHLLTASLAAGQGLDGGFSPDGGEGADGGQVLDQATQILQTAPTVSQQLKEVGSALELLRAPDGGTAAAPELNVADVHLLLKQHKEVERKIPEGRSTEFEALTAYLTRARAAARHLARALAAMEKRRTPQTVEEVRTAMEALAKADVDLQDALGDVYTEFVRRTQPTNAVVSGGVSLGAYQAGVLHYYSQYLLQQRMLVERLAPDTASQPQTITGASAGAINAFLTAMAACREPVAEPEESLFWKVWMAVDLNDLIAPKDVTPTSIFSHRPIAHAVQLVQEEWRKGPWRQKPCAVNLGFTVTRVSPRTVSLNGPSPQGTPTQCSGPTDPARKFDGQVPVPIQTERVIIGMSGQGGRSPALKSWVPTSAEADRAFFTEFPVASQEGDALSEAAASVLTASAAFPVAWPFVELESERDESSGCTKEGTGQKRARLRAPFLDGGVFDNNPLRLAAMLQAWSQKPAPPGDSGGLLRARLMRDERVKGELPPSRFLYVEPDATAWSGALAQTRAKQTGSFLTTYAQLLSNLVGTARRAELASTIEVEPKLRSRIDVPMRQMPITGSYLLNFFAFLEQDFRRFDFYMGMADAEEYLKVQATERPGLEKVVIRSPEYDCVKAFRRRPAGSEAPLPACEALVKQRGEGDLATKNLLALLSTSQQVRRFIYEECIDKGVPCASTREFETLSRELDEHGYTFRNKALKSTTVLAAVREQVHPLIDALASQQASGLEAAGVRVLGKAGLDALAYRPAGWYFGAGLHSRNGYEVELGFHLAGPLHVALGHRVTRIQSRFVQGEEATVRERWSFTNESYLSPLALELSLPWKGWWWLKLDLQVGAAFNVTSVGFNPASYRVPVQGALGVVVLQRFYLRANGAIFLDGCDRGACGNLIAPYQSQNDRMELAGTYADWSISLGWRFLE